MNVILLEADYLDAQGETQTLHLASAPFCSAPGDAPANQPYDDFIIGGLRVSSRMNEVLLGATTTSGSAVEILNMPGLYLTGNFAGQQGRFFMGEVNQPKATFKQIYTATIDDLVVKDAERLSLKIRSHDEQMDEPLQQIDIGETGYKKPIAYGQCRNVQPAVVDDTTFKYSVNEVAITSIQAVRSAGIAVTRVDNPSAGEFSFSAEQGGTITADVNAPLGTAKEMILDILARVNVTDIDTGSLDLLPVDAMALYLAQEQSAIGALDTIVNSIGAYWHFKRNGQFTVGLFREGQPSTAIIYPDEIMHHGLSVIRTIKPAKDIKLTYNRNWTQQEGSLDAAVTIANREAFKQPGDLVTTVNAGIILQYPNAQTRSPSVLLKTQVAAQAEADRRATLLNKTKRVYQVKAFTAPFDFELGQTITVIYPYLDFGQGRDVIIVGIIDDPLKGTSTIEVFG